MANVIGIAQAERACTRYFDTLTTVSRLVATLGGPGPFTLFVPIDAAFDRLHADQQAMLIADPGKMASMLMYHIVPGYYTTDDLLDRLFLKTLEGQRLKVCSDVSRVNLGEEAVDASADARSYIAIDTVTPVLRASIKINRGLVLRADMSADNGIVHLIDKVLIPPFPNSSKF
jgi:uncharacterized surface protein with fasciclin (FAS1) repeats